MRHYLKQSLLLLFFHTLVLGEQQCLSLSESHVCRMYHSAYISIQDPDLVAFPWLTNVSSIASFDQQLMSYIDSPAFWHIEFGCQSSIERRARYAITVTCATIVFHAQQICHSPQQNRTMLPLCRSTCELFSDSVQSIVNSALLEDDCSQEIFSKNYEQLEEHCGSNDNMSRLSPSGCISGSDFEPDLCGFGDNKDALCYYCNTQEPMLPCCQEQHCIKSDSTVPVIAIVLGSVGGLILGAFILFCVIRKRQKTKRRSTHPKEAFKVSKEYLEPEPSLELTPIRRRTTTTMIPSLPTEQVLLAEETWIENTRHVYPIEDEDYTEISPDIPIDYEVEGVKEHVFKVDSLGQQFVRVNHSREAPQKPDELELIQNDIIRMYCYFDDGWGLGDNLGSGLRGLFPLLCVVNLTAAEIQELLYINDLAQVPEEETCATSSVRYFSTGVQYDLNPTATIRLQTLRRTLSSRENKSMTANQEINNFHYLMAEATAVHNEISLSTLPSLPQRSASMHAKIRPRQPIKQLLEDSSCTDSVTVVTSNSTTPLQNA